MKANSIAVMQPYFFPYLGYFQMIHAVNAFVIFDDVNFIKKSYITRNQIELCGKEYVFTLPVLKASQNKNIKDLEANPDLSFLKTISHAYSKTPYFEQIMTILEKIFHYSEKNLARFLGNSLQVICDYINVNSKMVYSSEIQLSEIGKNKIIPLCKYFNAKTYINREGGVKLYRNEDFIKEGIALKFIIMKEGRTTVPKKNKKF